MDPGIRSGDGNWRVLDVLEVSPAATAIMSTLAARIAVDGGAALVIDYGYEGPAFGDTLQAVRGHAYADPLAEPGEADLTAHVDFAALARAAIDAGAVAAPARHPGRIPHPPRHCRTRRAPRRRQGRRDARRHCRRGPPAHGA